MKLILLRGISGSGKTTWSKKLRGFYPCSADYYMLVNGVYQFHPDKLPMAHTKCQARVKRLLSEGQNVLVDNTNTRDSDLMVYIRMGLDAGAEVEVVTLLCDPQEAFQRNRHEVPLDTIRHQHENLVASLVTRVPGVTYRVERSS